MPEANGTNRKLMTTIITSMLITLLGSAVLNLFVMWRQAVLLEERQAVMRDDMRNQSVLVGLLNKTMLEQDKRLNLIEERQGIGQRVVPELQHQQGSARQEIDAIKQSMQLLQYRLQQLERQEAEDRREGGKP